MASANFKGIFFLLCSLSCVPSQAQITSDSLHSFVATAAGLSKGPFYKPLVNNLEEIPVLISADSLARVTDNVAAQAALSEALGYSYHIKDPDKSIAYAQKAYTLFIRIENKKRAAQCLHNIAFEYDEQKHDIPQAIKYTKLAISARTELKDTMAIANMDKYLGFLQGKTHDFDEAKKNLAEAIRLFTIKKFAMGIGVCYRDLATVYEEDHKPDSCIANVFRAQAIWNERNDTNRIFDLNNILFRVYLSGSRLADAEICFHKNESMMNSSPMQNVNRAWNEILEYYRIGQAFFAAKKDEKMMNEYKIKYTAYKEHLKSAGIKTD